MLDRTIAPPAIPLKTFLLPTPTIISKSGGVPIIHLNNVTQPVIRIEFIFKAGKWFEPIIGLSHFTAHMLEKGTLSKTSSQIALAFDFCGAHIDISAGGDFVTLSLYSLERNLEQSLQQLIEIIKTPSFPDKELIQMKTIYQQNLKVNKEKTSYMASSLFREVIFGASHPYGSHLDGDRIDQLSRTDLVEYHNQFFYPFEIHITGDIPSDMIKMVFENFSAAPNTNLTHAHKNPNGAPSRHHYPMERSIQTSIRMGKHTLHPEHADYFKVLLLNHILGGYFGSRLMQNIREEKGLTYGIHSSITSFLHARMMVIGADVNKEDVEVAIEEIKKEIMALTIISREEFETTRNHFLGSIQLDMANPFSVADKIKSARLHKLPENYYSTLFKTLLGLSPQELTEAVAEHFSPDQFTVVTAG